MPNDARRSSSQQVIAIAPRMMTRMVTNGHQLDAVLAGALTGRIGRRWRAVKLLLR